jgi:heme/copper-type cytochrome/quinol oxidase subunit 4
MLHDQTELIEHWIGLGLMVAAFVLALWLVPAYFVPRWGRAVTLISLSNLTDC